ncbi:serrate RNA effector molecule homolog [Pocillopora verrucosa]|uniref:serrate RNA effector molecule homolog n=1 Tax=Pocillopora verrucosa TaxID=203993 RepID=UPI00333FECEE
MDRRQLLLVAVLSVTCCVYAQQGPHTVFAMVLGKGGQKMPEIKVNGVKMNLHNPVSQAPKEPGALVQGPPSDTTTFIVGSKASNNSNGKLPVMAEALVMPATKKPKTAEDKAMDDLKLTKEEKEKLFPCEDYKPYCKNYAQTGQCRDVYTQRYCRKSCDLCKVPYGVFIGCQDLDVCKKFAASACMVHWVRETCKSKCGTCGYERQGNAHITIGKKRHFSDTIKKQDKTTQKVEKIETKQIGSVKQLQKVLKKMTKKVKDAVKQVAAKVETLEKKNDKPVIAKPVIKPTQTRSDNDASEKNSDDDDINDDNDNADDEDATDQDVSGEGSSDDENEDDNDHDDNASGVANAEDKPEEPIRLDTDPRGEPVVAKMVHQPIKFNDAPLKAMHVKIVKSKKQAKKVEDAKPKVEVKKTAKKVSSDKVVKKAKKIDKVVKQDKPKIKTTKPKKLKN